MLIIVSEFDKKIPQSHCRQAHDTARKSHTTIKRHQEDKRSKATSFLFPHQDDCNSRMDVKIRTTNHRTITESHNRSNNQQRIDNYRATALECLVFISFQTLKCTCDCPQRLKDWWNVFPNGLIMMLPTSCKTFLTLVEWQSIIRWYSFFSLRSLNIVM